MADPQLVKLPKKINVVVEYRLTMPLSLEEYRRGQIYATAKSSLVATMVSTKAGGNAGVVVKENHPMEGENPNVEVHGRLPKRAELASHGAQRTLKEIHFGKNLPKIVNAVLPKDAKFVEERCWNSFPYVLTLYTSRQSYLCPRLFISVESMHYDADRGEQENVFALDAKELATRKVVNMDIANDHVGPDPDTQASSPPKKGQEPQVPVGDPRTFKSEKTGRGPLSPEWRKESKGPVMTAYKLVRLVCDVPFHSKIENAVLKSAIYDLVLNAHKNMFCSLDEWVWLDTDTIREFERAAFSAASAALEGDRGPAELLKPPQSPETEPEWARSTATTE
eukprot:TRINITY_DN7935_c0_g1_i4.p1 TRINITY_DN7935_c0_g1~~TRINITY_DN7935_c0_g1_i4.p1  ORF type:complete len:351 (+),score=69.92 TRINITY_DN7935_c0_g1_i4:48-1055(+)